MNSLQFHTKVVEICKQHGIPAILKVVKHAKLDPRLTVNISLFSMKNAYRQFTAYSDTLLASIRAPMNKKICFRIYIDDSLPRNTLDSLTKCPNVEVVYFCFPDFKIADSVGHQSTFGTLVRLLPLFDFGGSPSNGINMCFDADMRFAAPSALKCVTAMRKHHAWVYCLMYHCQFPEYTNRVLMDPAIPPALPRYLMALNITERAIDHRIFIRFLLGVRSGMLRKWALTNHKRKSQSKIESLKQQTRDRDSPHHIAYGVDELFLNSYVAPVWHEQTAIIGTIMYMDLRKLHYRLYQKIHASGSRSEAGSLRTIVVKLSDMFQTQIPELASPAIRGKPMAVIKLIDQFYSPATFFTDLNSNVHLHKNYFTLLSQYAADLHFTRAEMDCLTRAPEPGAYVDDIYLRIQPIPVWMIVPFADLRPQEKRTEQLKRFIEHINRAIKSEALPRHTQILIAEQALPRDRFNKGRLLNAAAAYLRQDSNPNLSDAILILHDVDILPDSEMLSQYLRIERPAQLMSPKSATYRKVYDPAQPIPVGGGVTVVMMSTFAAINGFPNDIWGWGGEDNCFQQRLGLHKLWYYVNEVGSFTSTDTFRTSEREKMRYINENALAARVKPRRETLGQANANGMKQVGHLNIIKVSQTGHIRLVRYDLS